MIILQEKESKVVAKLLVRFLILTILILSGFKNDGHFSDVTIEVFGKQIHAHKVKLTGFSFHKIRHF